MVSRSREFTKRQVKRRKDPNCGSREEKTQLGNVLKARGIILLVSCLL